MKVDSITALDFIVYLWSETQSRAHVADGNRSIFIQRRRVFMAVGVGFVLSRRLWKYGRSCH